jgi:4-hydroxybenzoate polyprenyltransferase
VLGRALLGRVLRLRRGCAQRERARQRQRAARERRQRCARPAPRIVSAAVLAGLLKTLRPRQWVKNFFVLAPLVFAKDLFRPAVFLRALAAFAVFSLLAGAVYTINDLVDADADRRHPTKRHRPIAAGVVPPGVAQIAAVVLVVGALAGGAALDLAVAACALAYLANNLAYSLRIKHVPYLDVVSIALGFVLRVLAGSYAVSTASHRVRPSVYLIACTALLALFLGFGKRRHELKVNAARARASLEAYDPRTLTFFLYGLGAITATVYVMYTLDRATQLFFRTRYLWLTTPFVVVGILIFIHLVRDEARLESPTDEMLRNVPFVLNLVLWALTIVTIVYQLRPAG